MKLCYLATPYSKYADGLEAAFQLACRHAALLIRNGIPVFSPIAHSHPIALGGGLDPLSHDIWLAADRPLMEACDVLVVVMAEGWEDSFGVRHEIDVFSRAGKRIVWMQPGQLHEDLIWARDEVKAGRAPW